MLDLQPLVLDVNGFFDHVAGERGLRRAEVEALAPRITSVLKDLGLRREAGKLPFYGLPYDESVEERLEKRLASLMGSERPWLNQ